MRTTWGFFITSRNYSQNNKNHVNEEAIRSIKIRVSAIRRSRSRSLEFMIEYIIFMYLEEKEFEPNNHENMNLWPIIVIVRRRTRFKSRRSCSDLIPLETISEGSYSKSTTSSCSTSLSLSLISPIARIDRRESLQLYSSMGSTSLTSSAKQLVSLCGDLTLSKKRH